MKKLLLIYLLATVVMVIACKKESGSNLPVKMPPTFNYSYPTPFGVMIYSVVEIPEDKKAAVFSAIETGIKTQIETSSLHNPTWNNARLLSDYRVAFINPDTTNLDGSPALLYQGHVQTAGTVLGVGNDGFNPAIIVLPHQANQNWSYMVYLRDSARNESEHFAEWFNDQNIFYRFTGFGDSHPHWKMEGEAKIFVPPESFPVKK